jgi:hypothetical protein
MNWTKKLPDRPGLWLARETSSAESVTVRVEMLQGELYIGPDCDMLSYVSLCQHAHAYAGCYFTSEPIDVQWLCERCGQRQLPAFLSRCADPGCGLLLCSDCKPRDRHLCWECWSTEDGRMADIAAGVDWKKEEGGE